MLGRDRDRRPEPQLEGLGDTGRRRPALAFVGEQDDRPAAAPQQSGERAVERRHPGPDIDDEQHDVGFLQRRRRLPLHPCRQHVAAGVLEPCRIDHPEGKIGEPGEALPAVAGYPRGIIDDRLPPAHQPVEQGRLPDVRAPDDGNDRPSCRFIVIAPADRTGHGCLSDRQTARRRRRAGRRSHRRSPEPC